MSVDERLAEAAVEARDAWVRWANLYGWPHKRREAEAHRERARAAARRFEDAMRERGR